MRTATVLVAAFLKIPANLNNPQTLESLLEIECEIEMSLYIFQKQYSTFVKQ